MARHEIFLVTGEDLQRAALALRVQDARFPGELRRRITRTVRPFIQEVKSNARRIPTHGTKHTGLRRRVAAGVFMHTRTSRNPGVVIGTRMADPSEAIIPRGMDRQSGWRHPVFGNREVWVDQRTGGSWFSGPLARKRDSMVRAIHDEMEDLADRIERDT